MDITGKEIPVCPKWETVVENAISHLKDTGREVKEGADKKAVAFAYRYWDGYNHTRCIDGISSILSKHLIEGALKTSWTDKL